jgi:hypothetical protein
MQPSARDREVISLYGQVFSAATDRIPLVTRPRGGPPGASFDDLWRDAPSAVARQAESALFRAPGAGDSLPTVNVGLYQAIAIPSVFGAEVMCVEGSEPVVKPCFGSLGEALRAGAPPLDGPVVERMMRTLSEALAALSGGVYLSFPAASSPFDLAQLMLGAEFLVAVAEDPGGARALLMNLADLFVRANSMVLAPVLERQGVYVTNRGVPFPGFRVPADSIVNMSPASIREVALPALERIAGELGPVCLHFCTEPAPSGHVLPALLDGGCVAAVDNWQGPDVFLGEGAPAAMQSRIAVVSDVKLPEESAMDAFLSRRSVREVPRRGGRGLVVSTGAESVARAQELHALWRERAG